MYESLKNFIEDVIYDKDIKVLVIEGYDMTGKSTFINSLMKLYNKNLVKYNNIANIPYEYKFIQNITLFNFIDNLPEDKTLILDRGIISAIAYNSIFNQKSVNLNTKEFFDYVISTQNDKVAYIYLYHPNDEVAKYFFNKSKSRNDNNDYDPTSFDRYITLYHQFDELYMKLFNDLKVKYFTYPTDRLNRW